MGITKTPFSVQPAFNEVTVIDDADTSLTVQSVAPSPVETITLHHVLANGGSRFDLKGFLSKLFYEGKVQIATSANWSPWVFNDGRLLVSYKIGADTTPYYALNAVQQLGESLDLIEEEKPVFLTGRARNDKTTTRIPCYDGYPVGVSMLYRNEYALNTDAATTVTIQVTANQTIRFPFLSSNGFIVYGDGTMDSTSGATGGYKSHTYTTAGTYTVYFLSTVNTATAVVPRTGTYATYFVEYKKALRTFERWGNGLISATFYECAGLTTVNAICAATTATLFAYMFYGCTSLTSIPGNYFSGVNATTAAAVTDLSYMFFNCRLTSLPTINMFVNATTVNYCFYGCRESTIPVTLFSGMSKITGFSYTFAYNTNLTTIDAALFTNASFTANVARDFSYTFAYCTSLTSIGQYLLRYLPVAAHEVSYMFAYDTALTSLPTDFIRYNTSITTVDYMFIGSGLTAVPEGFLRYTSVTSARGTFSGNKITSIPANFFTYATALTMCDAMFSNNPLTGTIPETLFNTNGANITSCTAIFSGCAATTFPQKLLWPLVNVTNFGSFFASDTALTSIPAQFFNIPGHKATSINSLFANANLSGLVIPADLFAYFENVTTATYLFANSSASLAYAPTAATFSLCGDMFRQMTSLTELIRVFAGGYYTTASTFPSGLFTGCGHIVSVERLFEDLGCSRTSATGMPVENLFEGLVNVTNAYGLFGSAHLTGILPSRLLDPFVNVTNAAYMFGATTGAPSTHGRITAVDNTMFDKMKKVTSFNGCFNYQKIHQHTPTGSDNLELWQRAGQPGYPAAITGNSCFYITSDGLSWTNGAEVPSTFR